ncbi:MAG: hypothetical protein A3E84_01505 [Gammaproteobacteria bacterium RIFCSPHIGHO2_12_FULL_42_13]|nr:MAG: hypothetical protein A3E84_01505 [Gammaproteobacteria bacterium RIFCSPHIGHO2_12_FULL_42_13]
MWHCARYNQGFILIIVLVYLQIFSIFSLFALAQSLLSIKISKSAWKRTGLSIAAERALQYAENKILYDIPSCMIPIMSANDLSKQPINWWSNSNCKGTVLRMHYYYVVEAMGKNPCAIVRDNSPINSQTYTANYHRVSVLVVEDKQYRLLLQSTLIKAEQKNAMCNERYFSVKSGRQMWREVPL